MTEAHKLALTYLYKMAEIKDDDLLKKVGEVLDARITALETLLEISIEHDYDGIDSRDGTISLLKHTIKQFRERKISVNQSDIIKKLTKYNEWRRGGEGEQPCPTTLGITVDGAIKLIVQQQELIDSQLQTISALKLRLEGLTDKHGRTAGLEAPSAADKVTR